MAIYFIALSRLFSAFSALFLIKVLCLYSLNSLEFPLQLEFAIFINYPCIYLIKIHDYVLFV